MSSGSKWHYFETPLKVHLLNTGFNSLDLAAAEMVRFYFNDKVGQKAKEYLMMRFNEELGKNVEKVPE